jgi:hypothetical protein
MQEACVIHDMNSSTDYRKLASHKAGLYFVSPSREEDLWARFVELTNSRPVVRQSVEVAMGRRLELPRAGGFGVARVGGWRGGSGGGRVRSRCKKYVRLFILHCLPAHLHACLQKVGPRAPAFLCPPSPPSLHPLPLPSCPHTSPPPPLLEQVAASLISPSRNCARQTSVRLTTSLWPTPSTRLPSRGCLCLGGGTGRPPTASSPSLMSFTKIGGWVGWGGGGGVHGSGSLLCTAHYT